MWWWYESCLAPPAERSLHCDDDHEEEVGQHAQAAQAGQQHGGQALLLKVRRGFYIISLSILLYDNIIIIIFLYYICCIGVTHLITDYLPSPDWLAPINPSCTWRRYLVFILIFTGHPPKRFEVFFIILSFSKMPSKQVNWIYIFPTPFDISLKQSKKSFLRGHRVCKVYSCF